MHFGFITATIPPPPGTPSRRTSLALLLLRLQSVGFTWSYTPAGRPQSPRPSLALSLVTTLTLLFLLLLCPLSPVPWGWALLIDALPQRLHSGGLPSASSPTSPTADGGNADIRLSELSSELWFPADSLGLQSARFYCSCSESHFKNPSQRKSWLEARLQKILLGPHW